MTEERRTYDIGARLENWGAWARERAKRGISPTGKFCDQLEREALGDLSGAPSFRRQIDEKDAQMVEDAILTLVPQKVLLLKLCYVKGSQPEYVARKCRFRVRDFTPMFRSVQRAVECALEMS